MYTKLYRSFWSQVITPDIIKMFQSDDLDEISHDIKSLVDMGLLDREEAVDMFKSITIYYRIKDTKWIKKKDGGQDVPEPPFD